MGDLLQMSLRAGREVRNTERTSREVEKTTREAKDMGWGCSKSKERLLDRVSKNEFLEFEVLSKTDRECHPWDP